MHVIALVLAAALAFLAAPAAAGPFTGNGTQPGLAHPILPGGSCTGCHGNFDAARNYEPGPTWQGTMMAQSARDPLFWAALDVANADVPGIGEFCLRCHAPGAWLAGRSEPPGGSVDGCGMLGMLDQPDGDFDGVTCHFCHRMQVNPAPPPGQTSLYFDNAQFWLDDGTCGGLGEPCRHGPYDYPADGTPAPHAWAFSPYLESSEMCAACHNVTNPAKNLIVGGTDTGIRFPIERTYREWQLSDFGFPLSLPGPDFLTCQQCHMPDALQGPAYGSSFLLNDHAGDLPMHHFAGGNAWIPAVLAGEYPALGIGTSLDATRLLALDMLQQQSAQVTLDVADAVAPEGTLSAAVTVTNLSGHKLPTGYPEGRRMWLHVEARDATGALVFESGAYDPATGALTHDPQVKVYEAKQGIWDPMAGACETDDAGRELFHFARNDCVALDNRIPPKGFTGGADLQTAPVGHVYPETSPGSGKLVHWDVTSYAMPLPPGAVSPIAVTATLRYQTTSKEYVEFLRDEAVTRGFADDCHERTDGFPGVTRGELLHDLWTAYDRSPPVDMGSASASAAIVSVDPMLCYKAKGTKGAAAFVPVPGVGLDDRLGAAVVDAKKAKTLCEPASTTAPPRDPSTHLLALQAKVASSAPPAVTGLVVTDALGTITVDATKPELLLVPAALGTEPPAPSAHDLDTFSCWKAKTSRNAPKLAKGLQVTASGALTTPGKTFAVRAVRRVCVATERDGTPRKNPGAALVCYKVAPASGQPKHVRTAALAVASELGGAMLDTTGDESICLPAQVAP